MRALPVDHIPVTELQRVAGIGEIHGHTAGRGTVFFFRRDSKNSRLMLHRNDVGITGEIDICQQ